MKAKPAERRRRVLARYSAEDRERLIQGQAQSGLTKKAFCEQEGINLGTFPGWRKRRVAGRKPAFAEVTLSASPQAAVEVTLTNGVRVGIHHQGKRDELVALIRGVAGC